MSDYFSELKKYFENRQGIALAFFFGSLSRGRGIPESDADVAIWLEPPYSLTDVSKIQSEIESIVKRNVDLIVLNEARPSIAWAALRGKALMVRDYGFYLRKMLDISREAEDFQNFLFDLWSWRRKVRGAFA